ncbi:Tautomerase/MIF [Rhizophagus irregularis]|uniref:L-dopachrome isomerase n=1 Tax=Rhizophagus irregularis TaxID=588596 RepID=A0A2N0PK04_9GLOM|nr:Tautomerase/MIF [Rhizophagus irregularis]PKC11674.1 Tautomerase/MIF [Rhizophagus irregularis]
MPYIEIKTNVQVQDHKKFIKELSTYSAAALNKPISYICVSLQDNLSMLFNDSDEPTYIAGVTSIGLDSATKTKMSKELGEWLEKELKASNDRGYIFYYAVDPANVGYKGSLIGQLI